MRCVLGVAVQQRPPIKTSHVVPEVLHTPCVGVLGPTLPLGAQPAPEEADAPAQHQQQGSSAVLRASLVGVTRWHLNRLTSLQDVSGDIVSCLLQSHCPATCWAAST